MVEAEAPRRAPAAVERERSLDVLDLECECETGGGGGCGWERVDGEVGVAEVMYVCGG